MKQLPDRRAVKRPASLWVLWSWFMVAFVAVSLAAGVIGGILSPTIVLDLVSFWPLLALGVFVGVVLVPFRSRLPDRIMAIVPLRLISVVGLVVGLHITGWSQLPSSAADLTGPGADGVAEATFDTTLGHGTLTVAAGAGEPLYTVRLNRAGGPVGIPDAVERGEDPVEVLVRERDGGRWFRTAGWSVRLHGGVRWTVDVAAPRLDVDLTAVPVASLDVAGAGTVRIGPVPSVAANGDLTLVLPAGVGALVRGPAQVPGDWIETNDGMQSLDGEVQIVVEVADGATVTVEQR